MAISVDLNVYIDAAKLTKQFEALKDDNVMYQIHDLFRKMCDPYIPMETGTLAQTTVVEKDKVTWTQPYARYMYMGELYLAANGSSWAKKDEKKFPSGKPLHYSTEKHMLASKEWDKAMMSGPNGELFLKEVAKILIEKLEGRDG